MLTGLILICAVAVGECTQVTATDVMRVPTEFANPVTCFLHAQAYLAETSLAADLRENDRIKIVCVRKS